DQISKVPTRALKVFDVTGAGDTVIAALALGLAGGLDLITSCQLANFAGGVVVGNVGCVPCELSELRDAIVGHEV
ncbi:MAG: PfkB family carbohydrate kinase, partial [Bdellovibrionales bacterium]